MTDQRASAGRLLAGRDVLVVYVASLALLAVAVLVPFRPLQVPGALLLVAFDALQRLVVPGVAGTTYDVLLAAFLYALSVAVAWARRAALARARERRFD